MGQESPGADGHRYSLFVDKGSAASQQGKGAVSTRYPSGRKVHRDPFGRQN